MVITPLALHTDRYELTMIDAALRSGTAHRRCVFDVFARKLPAGRRYGVVAGTGRLLEHIENFRFTEEAIRWLADGRVVHQDTLEWLSNYRFSGTIYGYHEGETYFPNSPVLVVESTFAEAVILETLVLSVMNYDSAVASAAARMVMSAKGRPIAEMGSRRTNESSAVAAARASYIAGFGATSNLAAGKRWGIPTMGTAAHAFTLLYDNEEAAFTAQVNMFGSNTTLLVDTFDVRQAVQTAIKVAGPQLGAVRLDSGDLPLLVTEVRKQLDDLGAHNTKITATGDLNEYAISVLAGSPADSYGVGTAVVTGSGAPAADMVYKMVAHENESGEWVSVAKTSPGKATTGGRKYAARHRNAEGIAISETIHILDDQPTPQPPGRPLLIPLVIDGNVDSTYLGVEGTRRAREHCAMALAELPANAQRLADGEPAIPTLYR